MSESLETGMMASLMKIICVQEYFLNKKRIILAYLANHPNVNIPSHREPTKESEGGSTAEGSTGDDVESEI